MDEESVSKKMRSPTLTVKSWVEPGVALPARPRSAALFGTFLDAQPATISVATRAIAIGLRIWVAIRRMTATPSHLRCFFEQSVTKSGLTGVQETGLIFRFRYPRNHPAADLARNLCGNAAETRPSDTRCKSPPAI